MGTKCRISLMKSPFFNVATSLTYGNVNILYKGIAQCRIRHANIVYLGMFVLNLYKDSEGKDSYYYRGRE